MADAQARIEQLRGEAEAAIASAADAGELEELRVRYLGRKAELTGILRGIGQLPAEERGPVGTAGNETRETLERLLEGRRAELEAAELEQRLAANTCSSAWATG
jgi:phenylalanyl-tRNA synthetase alpha chain